MEGHNVMVVYMRNDDGLEILRTDAKVPVWPPRPSDIEEMERIIKDRYGYRKMLVIGWYPLGPEVPKPPRELFVTYIYGQLAPGSDPLWTAVGTTVWTAPSDPPKRSDLERLREELMEKHLCPDVKIVNWKEVAG